MVTYVLSFFLLILVAALVRYRMRPRALAGPRDFPLLVEFVGLFKPFTEIYPFIHKLIKKYGGVFQADRFGRTYVLLSEPESVEALLTSSIHIKKGEYDYAFMKKWLKEGLLLSHGKKWQYRRKLLTPTFHFKILEDAMGSLSTNAEILTEKLLASGGQPVEIDNLIRASTLCVILETAMGVTSSSDDKNQNEYINAIKRVPEAIMKRYYRLWKHIDFLYNLSSESKSFYKDIATLQSFTKKVIASRREQYLKEIDSQTESPRNKRKPFLDSLIQLEISNPGSISEDGICEEVDTFMFEGHDTTASALNSALFLLANHPAEQEKAAEEQSEIFGDDSRPPTLQDLHRMEYLEMVVKETLRLYPSVPMISRSLTQDLKIDENTVVPAGNIAVALPYFVHRSEKHWEEPEEFRPERFAPGVSRHPFAFIPFSAGPRNCIGQKFAMMELKTAISGILRKCRLEPVTTSIKPLPTIVHTCEPSIKIKVFPRCS